MVDNMSIYCDTMDGPIVTAAELALEMENVNYVLPLVKKEFETELKEAFDNTIIVRELSGEAAEVADYWFFETAVRLYMLGVGKPYTGIKHSGLKKEHIILKAYTAIENQDKTALEAFLLDSLREAIETRYEITISKKDYEVNDTDAAREYMNSMLDFVEFSNELLKIIESK
jgi:hypothetical protein